MPSNIENRRARFYDRVIRLDVDDQPDAFFNEVIETGGIYTTPRNENWKGSHLVEISLHGVSAFGMTEEEAISNWIRQARRVIRAEVSA
ncbi:hypothetical protein Q4560_04995 [Celeribacter halophilus]|uniref:hypothetical protein n=1 Tax=Celeribacter halophilus TaxID=576117 RepID=UPI0026E2AE6F|nr:hypothetical protein [Celeribacter halophilus]MDO6722613.1 hypothetical protein [Celeribacter halophilus]